jgi:hypothetical protein
LVNSVDINVFVLEFNSFFLNNLVGLLLGLVKLVFGESTVVGLSASMSKEMTANRFNKTISSS